MFDSTPNSQHDNLNKAKKMKEQKNLNIAPKDVKNKWADNENSGLLRSYYSTNVNRPHPLPQNYNFTLFNDLLLTLVARRNFINRFFFHIKNTNSSH